MAGAQQILTELFHEDTDGQFIDVNWRSPKGKPIETDTVVSVTGSLWTCARSMTNVLSYQICLWKDLDLVATGRVSYPSLGSIRVTFLRSDLMAFGDLPAQERSLTLHILHSEDKHAAVEVLFMVQNLLKLE